MRSTHKVKNTFSNHTFKIAVVTSSIFGILAWLLPNNYFPWGSFYNDLGSWISLTVLLGVAATTLRDAALPNSILLPTLVALIPAAQALSGQIYFMGDGWIASIYLAGFILAYSSGFNLFRHNPTSNLEVIAWVFLLGAALSTCIAFYQWTGIEGAGIWVSDIRSSSRVYANLGQPNNLATLLCIGLAATAYLYMKVRISKASAILFAVLLIFGITMTQSRTPWIGLAFMLIWWGIKRRDLPRLHGSALIAFGLLYITLINYWPIIMESLHLAGAARENMATVGVRKVIWTQLLDAALRVPLSGYGWNQVSVAQVSVAAEYPRSELVEHSHNILIDLLIWNGLPIGLLIIAGIAYWLLTRAFRSKTIESWFALLVIGFVGIHGLLELPLEYAYFLLPIGLLAGLIDADQHTKATLRIPRPVAWGVFFTSLLILALVWQEYRVIEEDHRLMRFETAGIGHLRAEQPAPNVILLTQLREFIRYARTPARQEMSDDELEWMRRVAHRYPYPPSLFRYAFALAINGHPNEAAHQLKVIRQLHGNMLYEEAISALRESASTYPDLVNLLELL